MVGHWLGARVLVAGEWLHIPRFRARIERVDWSEDGRVVVRLQTASVDASYLEELEQAGWKTFPRHDADDWLKDLAPE